MCKWRFFIVSKYHLFLVRSRKHCFTFLSKMLPLAHLLSSNINGVLTLFLPNALVLSTSMHWLIEIFLPLLLQNTFYCIVGYIIAHDTTTHVMQHSWIWLPGTLWNVVSKSHFYTLKSWNTSASLPKQFQLLVLFFFFFFYEFLSIVPRQLTTSKLQHAPGLTSVIFSISSIYKINSVSINFINLYSYTHCPEL